MYVPLMRVSIVQLELMMAGLRCERDEKVGRPAHALLRGAVTSET
jgi:hypothetical protein